MDEALCYASAIELARLIRERRLSARELMQVHLRRIERLNPPLTAIVAQLPGEACLALADEADRRLARGEPVGPLHGLPVAFKDLEPAVGFPQTLGSPIFRDLRPEEDSVLVERLRAAGVRHGLADVQQRVRHDAQSLGPDPDRRRVERRRRGRAGGGTAANRRRQRFRRLATQPGQLQQHRGTAPHGRARADGAGTRVAWCPDLGGLPLERDVRAILDAQRAAFEQLGCTLEDAYPDLSGVEDLFLTLRAWRSWNVLGPLLDQHRASIKPEAIGEIEAGAKVTADDLARAMTAHANLLERLRRFQQRYEFIVCTVSQVPPFDAALHWPREVDGVPMPRYIDWMRSTWAITATWCPAVSVPAGFTPEGLPVGIQLVGRPRDDLGVLQLAHAFEQATNVGARHPALPTA